GCRRGSTAGIWQPQPDDRSGCALLEHGTNRARLWTHGALERFTGRQPGSTLSDDSCAADTHVDGPGDFAPVRRVAPNPGDVAGKTMQDGFLPGFPCPTHG